MANMDENSGGNGYVPTSILREEPAIPVETPEVAGAWRNPNTHAYISRVTGRNEDNLFLEEYYSSTDVEIRFDDIEQTEIGYIQYAIQEQLKPLYGYSSRTWDDVAIGNRIVTGMLKVPIRNIDVREYGKDLKNPSLDDVVSYLGLKTSFDVKSYNEAEVVETSKHDWIDIAVEGGKAPSGVIGSSVVQEFPVPETIIDYNYSKEDYPTKNPNVNHIGNPEPEGEKRIGYPSSSDGDLPTHITDDDEYIPEGPEEFIYRQKLQELGYDLENGSSALTFEKQIMKFQNDMKSKGYNIDIGSYGKLTSLTKQAIDEACNRKWAEEDKIIVPVGSKLYNMPSEQGVVIYTLEDSLTFIILQDSIIDSHRNVWQKITATESSLNYTGFYCVDICKPE